MNASIAAFGHCNNVGLIASRPRPLAAGAGAARPALRTARPSRYEEYRARAAECQAVANHWTDVVKQQYEELAAQWLMLASEELH